jgi:uncharacterized protein YecA (UPF0149 family)
MHKHTQFPKIVFNKRRVHPQEQLVNVGKNHTPNEPCPCKSGKKYKRCCGIIVVKKEEKAKDLSIS